MGTLQDSSGDVCAYKYKFVRMSQGGMSGRSRIGRWQDGSSGLSPRANLAV